MDRLRFTVAESGKAIPPLKTQCPFTYIFTWRQLPHEAYAAVDRGSQFGKDLHYGGVRLSDREQGYVHPEDMLTRYFSSSSLAKKLIAMGHEPDVMIHEIYSSYEEARAGETAMLLDYNAIEDNCWLNQHAYPIFTYEARIRGGKKSAEKMIKERGPIILFGKEYSTWKEVSNDFHDVLTYRKLLQWNRDGKDVEEGIIRSMRDSTFSPQSIQVTINGTVYYSLGKVSKAFNIPETVLSDWSRKGWNIEERVNQYMPFESNEIKINGIKYKSRNYASNILRIPPVSLLRHIRAGRTVMKTRDGRQFHLEY